MISVTIRYGARNDYYQTVKDAEAAMLPCPVCGAKGKIKETDEDDNGNIWWMAECPKCGAHTCDAGFPRLFPVVQDWNTCGGCGVKDRDGKSAPRREWPDDPHWHFEP